nr:ribonuclease H-like domain-containing protein [Tanacetum cinerariifolium]
MARLAFCDYHNMITILEKYEHNQDFHQIVDFVEASHIRIETTEEGTKILATIDGKLRTISESSIRRNLKLNDEAGISSLPKAELFENLQLMGYNILPNKKFTFQKGGFPISGNEPASPLGDDSQGKACPTDSGFKADHDRANIAKTSTLPSDSTPRVTSLAADEGSMQQKLDELTALCTSLQRQQSKMVSKFEAQKVEINSLKARIKLLEDKDRVVAAQSGDDAPIKGRRLDEGEEAAKRFSDDTEEMATVLTSIDAASILTSGGVQVVPTAAEVATATISIPTGSRVVSTASPIIPTAALIFTTATESTPYTRRKGKQKMVEYDTPKKKKLQEHINIARDAEVARIHAEEELQMMINSLDRSNEIVAKYLQEYEQIPKDLSIGERIKLISDLVKYQENYAQVLKYQTLQRNPRSKKQKKDYYMAIEDFILIGSKEETERFKRKGIRLEHESAKKLKTSKEVHEEVKSSEEVPEEQVKEMMQLGRIVGNKMHKAFPLPVMEFPLSEEVPTANEESSHCHKKRNATAEKIALLLKSSSNYQSKLYDSYANFKVLCNPSANKCTQFGDSYETLKDVVTTASASDGTGKKNGRTVTLTTNDMQKRKNDIDEDDMEEMDVKWNMALLSMRADRFRKKTGKKITIQGTDVAGFDKSKVECFNCHKMGHFARECSASRSQDRGRRDNYRQGSKVEEQTPKALMEIDRVG